MVRACARGVRWNARTCPGTTLSWHCACRMVFVVARCEFWHRSRNPPGTLCVSDCSRWGAMRILMNFDIGATLSALCACQITLWEFWHRSRTLCVSDRSRCGPVLILISLAQPPMGSLSLWRGARFDIARATFSSLCACQIALVVWHGVHSSWFGILSRSLCVKIWTQVFWRSLWQDLVQVLKILILEEVLQLLVRRYCGDPGNRP